MSHQSSTDPRHSTPHVHCFQLRFVVSITILSSSIAAAARRSAASSRSFALASAACRLASCRCRLDGSLSNGSGADDGRLLGDFAGDLALVGLFSPTCEGDFALRQLWSDGPCWLAGDCFSNSPGLPPGLVAGYGDAWPPSYRGANGERAFDDGAA